MSWLDYYLILGALALGVAAGAGFSTRFGSARTQLVDADFKLQLLDAELAKMRAALVALNCSGAWWCRSEWGHKRGCYGAQQVALRRELAQDDAAEVWWST